MTVVLAGVLLAAIDATIVVLALPEIQHDLGMSLGSVIWVSVGYLLVVTVLTTQVGRLGDLFGRVRMYEIGFAVFTLASVLCALSWNAGSVIGLRLVQGVGAALVAANSGAIIAELYPPAERGRAYGLNAFAFSAGSVLGVLLGGIIVTSFSWRWIFWINLPVGVAALLLAVRVLHDRGPRVRRRLDPWGMVTLGAGLFGVAWPMSELATGPLTPVRTGVLVAGVALLVAFAVIERRHPEPTLDLSLFRLPRMSPSFLAAFLQSLGSFAVLFLLVMYLQGVRGLSPVDTSMLMVPGYAVGAVAGLYAGRLVDRWGSTVPATTGLGISVVALLLLAQMTVTSPLWLPLVGNAVIMVGGGFFYSANSTAVMTAAPPDRLGTASGVLRTVSSIGMVFSFTTAVLVAAATVPRDVAFAVFVGTAGLHADVAPAFVSGLSTAFAAMTLVMLAAAGLSALRGGRRWAPS